jgi:hypothetical protein
VADTIYEHRITKGGRKTWDGEPHLDEEGWEEYQEWERFDYHEERYWRRPLTGDRLEAELERRARSDRRQAVKDKECAVIEAAVALVGIMQKAEEMRRKGLNEADCRP